MYFTHPYSSWENAPTNAITVCHDGLSPRKRAFSTTSLMKSASSPIASMVYREGSWATVSPNSLLTASWTAYTPLDRTLRLAVDSLQSGLRPSLREPTLFYCDLLPFKKFWQPAIAICGKTLTIHEKCALSEGTITFGIGEGDC